MHLEGLVPCDVCFNPLSLSTVSAYKAVDSSESLSLKSRGPQSLVQATRLQDYGAFEMVQEPSPCDPSEPPGSPDGMMDGFWVIESSLQNAATHSFLGPVSVEEKMVKYIEQR